MLAPVPPAFAERDLSSIRRPDRPAIAPNNNTAASRWVEGWSAVLGAAIGRQPRYRAVHERKNIHFEEGPVSLRTLVAVSIAGESKATAIWRPARLSIVSEITGEPGLARSVRVHDVEFAVTITGTLKRDATT